MAAEESVSLLDVEFPGLKLKVGTISVIVHESPRTRVATPLVVVFSCTVVRPDFVLESNDSTRCGRANIAKVVFVKPALAKVRVYEMLLPEMLPVVTL